MSLVEFALLCVYLNLYLFLGLRPRRTLRTVLWTAEEQGGVGAQQYYNLHKVLSTVVVFRETQCTSCKASIFLASEKQERLNHIMKA